MAVEIEGLSKRGNELVKLPDMRRLLKDLLGSPWDPKDNPDGFVNLGISENFMMVPTLVDFLNSKKLEFSRLQVTYGEGPGGAKRLRHAMTRFMTKHFKPVKPIDPDTLLFTNGCTGLFEILGWTVADPGEGILIPRPIYQAFPHDFGAKANIKMVYVDFGQTDQFSEDAVAKYEAALLAAEKQGIKTRLLMLCNPHNPLGKCYAKETIIGLLKLATKYKLHVISDEVYATSVYKTDDPKAVPFTSVLSFDTTPYISSDYLHVVYGLAKDICGGGFRLGLAIVTNEQLMRALFQLAVFNWPGGPNELVAATILEDEDFLERYMTESQRKLAEQHTYTTSQLDKAGIPYTAGSNAGFFLWLDLRKWLPQDTKDGWAAETELFEKLMANKVAINTGASLGAEQPGFFRLVFTQHRPVLDEGLARIFTTLGIDPLADLSTLRLG